MSAAKLNGLRPLVSLLSLLVASPALAQVGSSPPTSSSEAEDEQPIVQQQPRIAPPRAGRVAGSSVGEVGQRQGREQAATGIDPMARIASRVQNRVQSRIRNRIDRNYDPQANATSPFAIAEDEVRAAGQPR
jgi:hypothetical protein